MIINDKIYLEYLGLYNVSLILDNVLQVLIILYKCHGASGLLMSLLFFLGVRRFLNKPENWIVMVQIL